MSIFQELAYNSNIDTVTGVQFSILSPDEIRRRSVAEIYTQETYEGDKPKVGGLFDPRMGVLDHGKKCPTDHLDNRHCPGYFGHIELATPVFHIQYLKFVIQSLKCVCWKCSKLLLDTDSEEVKKIITRKRGLKRFTSIVSLCSKIKRCGEKNKNGCGAKQQDTIKKDNNGIGKIIVEWKLASQNSSNKKTIMYWDAKYVHKILRRISNEECEMMGFSRKFCRPDWLICSVFGVPPPSVRPSVRSDNNSRMEDDLTHKLCDIVKTNRTLKNKIQNGATKKVLDEWYQLLQYHIATFVDNTLPGIPPAQQRSGRALKSIKERLKSKEGRVRGNLMGKRVDYSARSVITPDPNISINELGVPVEIAQNLTYPEIVTKYNINKMRTIIKNGYNKYPGAKSIKRISDGKVLSLKVIDTNNYEINIGDIINRHLIDGDAVLFNRQPSLHRMSMMAHSIKVLPYKTFRLNVSVTTPYNADFDGDEMNMHVPQSLQTAIEIKKLASVETQIITPAQNRPIIALVQDSIIGSYLFTRYDNYLTRSEVIDLLAWVPSFNGVFPEPDISADLPVEDYPGWFPKYKYTVKQDLWSGRTIFSLVIPNINLEKNNMSYNLNSNIMNKVKINSGKIEHGVLDKSILGTKEGGLVHIIYNQYGQDRAMQFLDDAQNLITNWMLMSGFSVGLGDLIPDDESDKKMIKIIEDKKKNVIEIIEQVHKGILSNNTGKDNSEEFEAQVRQHLNQAAGESGNEGCRYLDSHNRMTNIVNSGSKGSKLNIGQMIACVGQQSVDGKRIPYGFTDRTLPHFHKYDDGAAARGFVENSFVRGLTPTEFFFHAMGGREGLIDTAVKTSETGYIQRKLVKGMEDIRVCFDYSVRNANGNIVQFLYGEDGIDPTKIEKQYIPTLTMDYLDIVKKYKLSLDDNWGNYIKEDSLEKMNALDKDYVESKFNTYFKRLLDDKKELVENVFNCKLANGGTVYYPINLKRLVHNTYKLLIKNKGKTDLDPIFILNKLDELEQKLTLTDNMFSENRLFMMLIHCYLSPNELIKKYSITRTAFEYIIGTITQQFFNSIAQPGDLVGIISAQSIGEPSTQMTLNTFHFAGVSSKSQVTRGLPRFKELLSTTKNVKSPYLTIYLKEEFSRNKEKASKIINEISITTIKQLALGSKIYFEPTDDEISASNSIDANLLEMYKEFESLDPLGKNCSVNPWVLRIEFDRKKLVDKCIKMNDIYYAIISKFNTNSSESNIEDDISCIYSDDNASNLVVRISCINKLSEKTESCPEEDTICILRALERTILNDIVLTGIKGIKSASMEKIKDINKFSYETNSFENTPEWVIETEGSNLLNIFKHPSIDCERTLSNDIHEINNVLGIEAARQVLVNEITDIFEQSSSYVNSRHLGLLADVITNKGNLMSIDRHGINKSDIGPLAKCSFEETPDIIARAAIFGELDNVLGVSANIMLGQEVPIGTGSVELLFDEEKYLELYREINDEEQQNDIEEIPENITEKTEFLNTLCDSKTFIDDTFDII